MVLDAGVPIQALTIQRERPLLAGVGFEILIKSGCLARRTQKREQCVRNSYQHEHPVAPRSTFDVRGAQTHPEVQVLRVPKRLLNRESPAIQCHHARARLVAQARRQTPRFFHPSPLDRHHGWHLRTVRSNACTR